MLEAPAHAAEAQLFARVAAGDTGEPLRRLYDRYERRLYGFWLRLWRSAGSFDPERGTVRALLFTIARRVAVDLWRRPSSRAHGRELEDAGAVTARVDEVLLAVTVRDAMEALSCAHREVLELVYEQDMTSLAIAERLGVPHGTVKSRIYHALRALRRALEERGWDG